VPCACDLMAGFDEGRGGEWHDYESADDLCGTVGVAGTLEAVCAFRAAELVWQCGDSRQAEVTLSTECL